MKTILKTLFAGLLALSASIVWAGDVPDFISKTYPSFAIDSQVAADNTLMGKDAALDAKTRELIFLGVAAQIPCKYCVYAHTRMAKANGATESEIREAVAAAAYVRQWSTILNGMNYSYEDFTAEVDKMLAK